jgi:protein gp37
MRDVIVGFKSFSPIWPYKIDSQGDKHLLQCLPNLWLGVTAENQAAANERIPILLDIPAAKRFVSVEPMLEKIDITPFVGPYDCMACGYVGAESARDEEAENDDEDMACPECGASENCGGFGFLESNPDVNGERINWVIAGAETGPGARPMNPEWARSLRDQCQAAEVLFFFKSWGEYMPFDFSYGKWCRWKDKKDPARYQLDGKIYREWPT